MSETSRAAGEPKAGAASTDYQSLPQSNKVHRAPRQQSALLGVTSMYGRLGRPPGWINGADAMFG